jgi:hypothetical protein
MAMSRSGPDAIDEAIAAGLDLDGSPIPQPMLDLYREVMDLKEQCQATQRSDKVDAQSNRAKWGQTSP